MFDVSSAIGYMGEKCFQEFGPRFLGAYPLTRSIQGKGFLHVATSLSIPFVGHVGNKTFWALQPKGRFSSAINVKPKRLGLQSFFQQVRETVS